MDPISELAEACLQHVHARTWHHQQSLAAYHHQDTAVYCYHMKAMVCHHHQAIAASYRHQCALEASLQREQAPLLQAFPLPQQHALPSQASTLPPLASTSIGGGLHQSMQPSGKEQPLLDRSAPEAFLLSEELGCIPDSVFNQGDDDSELLPLVDLAGFLGEQSPLDSSVLDFLTSDEECDSMLDLSQLLRT